MNRLLPRALAAVLLVATGITFYGGNYSDSILYRAEDVLVSEYILKAIGSDLSVR